MRRSQTSPRTCQAAIILSLVVGLSLIMGPVVQADPPGDAGIYAQNNLVAWCVVPFDASGRGPAERAEMLKALGLTKLAYDW